MTDRTMRRIRAANPFPSELPPPPIDGVWMRVMEGDERGGRHASRHGTARRRSQPGWLPGLGSVVAMGSTVVVVAVVAAAFTLLGHHRNQPGASGGRASITRPSTRALISELRILRQPQTEQDRRFYDRQLKHTHGVAIRHPIPGLTRLISLPHGSKLLLYVTSPAARLGGGGLGYDVTFPGGGSGACCITPNALRRPAGPSTWFATGPNPRTVHHQLYWEIVPDGVSRVQWRFPRQPIYPDAPPVPPYPAPLTVDVPVHHNVAARWLLQRGQAAVDTWFAADGRVIASLHRPSPKNPTVVGSPGSIIALMMRFSVFRQPQAAIGTPSAAVRSLAHQRLSRYVPIAGSFGVWLSLGRTGACIDFPLTARAKPQIAAGGCNSHLADVEAGGLFAHQSGARGTTGPVFVGMVPDATKLVRITLTDGQVLTPTPHDNVFSIPEPPGAKAPFRILRIQSRSGQVSTWCQTCHNRR